MKARELEPVNRPECYRRGSEYRHIWCASLRSGGCQLAVSVGGAALLTDLTPAEARELGEWLIAAADEVEGAC